MLGDRMAPFMAVDGLEFWVGFSPFVLQGGRYGSGEGAIQVMTLDGQAEMKLTVSLANYGAPALGPGEFWVKLSEDGYTHGAKTHRALLDLGIFRALEETIGQGRVARYAQRWRFTMCQDHAEAFGAEYAVACKGCRARLAEHFADGKTRLLAKDAVQRIKAMGKAEEKW